MFRYLFILMVIVFSSIYAEENTSDRDKIRNILDLNSQFEFFQDILSEKMYSSGYVSLDTSSLFHKIPNNPAECWSFYRQFVLAYTQFSGTAIQKNDFWKKGFHTGGIDLALIDDFLDSLAAAHPIPIVVEDFDSSYRYNKFDGGFEEYLNDHYVYYMMDNKLEKNIKSIIVSLKDPIQECLGYPWEVVNVRIWKTRPNTNGAAGAWHSDGFVPEALKIMIYPNGANKTIGSTALRLNSGEHILDLEKGAWVLFKNSAIVHRGIAPKPGMGDRPVIEITIAPAVCFDPTPVQAGLNAHYPCLPWLKPKTFYYASTSSEIKGINIGGGPGWRQNGWLNLEESISSTNPYSFKLNPTCKFPVEDKSINVIYTSHNFEHLNIPTVYRMLQESHRSLFDKGDLIIKIPDYDQILAAWSQKNRDYFFGSAWNFGSTVPTWKNKGIPDCIDHRASVILCSYYNAAHGNQFSSKCTPSAPRAYLGPAPISVSQLNQLILQEVTPQKIALALRKYIRKNCQDWIDFCHQSAWSRSELETMLRGFGFEVITFDKDTIISNFRDSIHDISSMRNISTYCWARKIK